MYQLVIATKVKIERIKKGLFPDTLDNLKRNFIEVSGLSSHEWNLIYNAPAIKSEQDLKHILNQIKG